MQDLAEQKQQLKDNLEAIRKQSGKVESLARSAKELTESDLHSAYQDWIDARTNPPVPNFNDANSVIAFFANSLVNTGIRAAGTYFKDVQGGPDMLLKAKKELETQITKIDEILQDDQSDWGLDDAKE